VIKIQTQKIGTEINWKHVETQMQAFFENYLFFVAI